MRGPQGPFRPLPYEPPLADTDSPLWADGGHPFTLAAFVGERKNIKKDSAKSCPTLVIPQTVAHQAPLSVGSSRQAYWSGLPFPSPGDLPDPGTEPRSPALQADTD